MRATGNSEVLNVRVAVDRGWGTNKQTDFFNLGIWGKQAESLAPVLQKGTYVFFTGEFGTRAYEYQGEKRIDLEVRVDRIELGPRSAAGSDDRRAAEAGHTQTQSRQASSGSAAVTFDEEIPF